MNTKIQRNCNNQRIFKYKNSQDCFFLETKFARFLLKWSCHQINMLQISYTYRNNNKRSFIKYTTTKRAKHFLGIGRACSFGRGSYTSATSTFMPFKHDLNLSAFNIVEPKDHVLSDLTIVPDNATFIW